MYQQSQHLMILETFKHFLHTKHPNLQKVFFGQCNLMSNKILYLVLYYIWLPIKFDLYIMQIFSNLLELKIFGTESALLFMDVLRLEILLYMYFHP